MKTTIRLLLTGTALCALGAGPLAAASPAGPGKAEILSAYMKTENALASDDFAAAKSAATALAGIADTGDQSDIGVRATAVARAADLSAAREAFKPLSASVVPLAAGEKDYAIMTCSMANADWVQAAGDVKNPYLGKAMQTCGEPKKIAVAPGHGCGGEPDAHQGHSDHAQAGCG